MSKRVWWLAAVLLILLLIVLWVIFFFPKNGATGSNSPSLPESGTGATRTADNPLAVNGAFGLAPVSKPAPVYNPSGAYQSGSAQSTYTPFTFSYPTRSAPSQEATRATAPQANTGTRTTPYTPIVPLVVTPVPRTYIPPTYTYATSTPGSHVIGHARNGDQITFDPLSGDLHVGEYHFNFGMGPVPNGSTSDIVGDPENVTLGNTIGVFIGSLVGDPALGLTLGTALGSNLVSGFRLSDFGIGLENGLPTIGGADAISSILGGSGLGSLGSLGGLAGLGGQNAYFGGRVFSMVCTCSPENFIWVVTDPVQYAGTYLYKTGSSRPYANYGFVGYFEALGSYTPNEGQDECLMYHGEDCDSALSEITKGTINSSPGYGSSLPF